MKFSTREDIERPADQVFAAVSDFNRFEEEIRARKIDIRRLSGQADDMQALSWEVFGTYRGRKMKLVSAIADFHAGEAYRIESSTAGLELTTEIEVKPLTSKKSRLFVSLELRPTSFSGRLFLQPMKLAKGKLTNRFKMRVGKFAAEIARG